MGSHRSQHLSVSFPRARRLKWIWVTVGSPSVHRLEPESMHFICDIAADSQCDTLYYQPGLLHYSLTHSSLSGDVCGGTEGNPSDSPVDILPVNKTPLLLTLIMHFIDFGKGYNHVPHGNHHHDYQHSHLDLTALTPKLDRPQRMNNILTSATEPYDLTLSRSFQNLNHQQPSYELPLKPDLSKYSPHRLSR
ncbi:hypothetical protein XENOCAPTIV_012705 [Xenoophorus captivus]|uniref:Uncharacterized protein n=1 Tax=Xenoophorus captivus TaxID=1517983 RepID=A0ABV0QEC3_9TELE